MSKRAVPQALTFPGLLRCLRGREDNRAFGLECSQAFGDLSRGQCRTTAAVERPGKAAIEDYADLLRTTVVEEFPQATSCNCSRPQISRLRVGHRQVHLS